MYWRSCVSLYWEVVYHCIGGCVYHCIGGCVYHCIGGLVYHCIGGWLVGFLTSSSTTRLYGGRAPRQSVWQFYVLPHMRQSWETMTSVSADYIILTPTQLVGRGRPLQESNPGLPHQESHALPLSYCAPLVLEVVCIIVLEVVCIIVLEVGGYHCIVIPVTLGGSGGSSLLSISSVITTSSFRSGFTSDWASTFCRI